MKRRKGLSDIIAEAAQSSLSKAKDASDKVEQGAAEHSTPAPAPAPSDAPTVSGNARTTSPSLTPSNQPPPSQVAQPQQPEAQPTGQAKAEAVIDRSLCPGCFKPSGQMPTCANCGHDLSGKPQHPMYLPPGLVLHDRYIIGRVLGQGGFGITYLGYDKFFLKKVAVKEYLPTALASRYGNTTRIAPGAGDAADHFVEGLRLFLEEARNLARLEHPNIIKIENYFEANNTGYMVMNFVAGPSLSAHLKSSNGKLPWREARTFVLPLLDALQAVHRKNIFHRDVSTQNILLADGKTPILIDFGAARQVVGEQSRSLDVVLKPGYSPLEQFGSKGNIGPWTDVYATAATIYLLLTGMLPPAATDRFYKDELVALADIPDLLVPYAFNDCILKALAVRGDERWQSVEEFRAALLEAEKAPTPEAKPAAQTSAKALQPASAQPAPEPKKPEPAASAAQAKPTDTKAAKSFPERPGTPLEAKGKFKAALIGVVLVCAVLVGFFAFRGTPKDAQAPAPAVAEKPAPPAPAPAQESPQPAAQVAKPSEADSGKPRRGEESLVAAKKKMAVGECADALVLLEKALAAEPGSREIKSLMKEAKASKGSVSIYADPWGYVVIDGKKTEQIAPLEGLELTCGRHTIRLVNPDFKDRSVDVSIRGGKRARISLIKETSKVLYD